jgi:tetratricopeptide (TPR) repeat protein
VELCGGSPLAIKSVGAAIRSGKVNAEMLARILEKDFPGLEMESRCLTQTFKTLDKSKQKLLVKLHVFGTAKFDLATAAIVLHEKSHSIDKTNANMIYLKSRHFVKVDDLSKKETEDITTTSKTVRFSLHPLVCEFLCQTAKKKAFKTPAKEAKCLFIDYVEKKNNEIFESFEKNCVKAWGDLKDFKCHLKTYYELIQKIDPNLLKSRETSRSILTCKRISEVADLFLEDYVKFKLLDKFIEHSMIRKDVLEKALWQVHLGRKFLECDRKEIAENILNCILNETLSSVSPTSGNLESYVEVVGAVFYLAGKLCLQDRKYCEAQCHFENVKQLWGKRLEKSRKNKYKIDLALVYNSLGKVYANVTPSNLQQSKYNHLKAYLYAQSISTNLKNIDIPSYIQNFGKCLYKEGLELEKRAEKGRSKKCFKDAGNYFQHAISLFTRFKMEKFDIFAEVQRSLAFAQMKLGQMALAEDNIVKAYDLRKKVMSPPHEVITLTVHDVATVRIERAIYMYWEYFEKKLGDKCKN